MTKTLTILAFLAVIPAGAALADDECFVPMADWQPREAVAQLAAGNGWTPRRIKIDDGCYEIDGRDEVWAALQLRKESSLWVLRAVLAYALCKNWRTPLKIAILDRIKMVGESREKTRANEAAAC